MFCGACILLGYKGEGGGAEEQDEAGDGEEVWGINLDLERDGVRTYEDDIGTHNIS